MQAKTKIVVENHRNLWHYTVVNRGHELTSSAGYSRRDNCLRGVRRLLNVLGTKKRTPVTVTNNTTGTTDTIVL